MTIKRCKNCYNRYICEYRTPKHYIEDKKRSEEKDTECEEWEQDYIEETDDTGHYYYKIK